MLTLAYIMQINVKFVQFTKGLRQGNQYQIYDLTIKNRRSFASVSSIHLRNKAKMCFATL